VIVSILMSFSTYVSTNHCCMQELRKQLEAQVLTIDTLRNESRSIVEHHESVSWVFLWILVVASGGFVMLNVVSNDW